MTEQYISRDTVDVALAENADLIVIGRGKSQTTFGALRTHAYDIIRRAPCPVLRYSVIRRAVPDSVAKGETRAETAAVR